jgi:hypothetical protein
MKMSSDVRAKNYEWSVLSFGVRFGGLVISDEGFALDQLETMSEMICGFLSV